MTLFLIMAVGVAALFSLIALVSAFGNQRSRDPRQQDTGSHTHTWGDGSSGSTSSSSSEGGCADYGSDTGSCDSGGGGDSGGGDGGGGGGGGGD